MIYFIYARDIYIYIYIYIYHKATRRWKFRGKECKIKKTKINTRETIQVYTF